MIRQTLHLRLLHFSALIAATALIGSSQLQAQEAARPSRSAASTGVTLPWPLDILKGPQAKPAAKAKPKRVQRKKPSTVTSPNATVVEAIPTPRPKPPDDHTLDEDDAETGVEAEVAGANDPGPEDVVDLRAPVIPVPRPRPSDTAEANDSEPTETSPSDSAARPQAAADNTLAAALGPVDAGDLPTFSPAPLPMSKSAALPAPAPVPQPPSKKPAADAPVDAARDLLPIEQASLSRIVVPRPKPEAGATDDTVAPPAEPPPPKVWAADDVSAAETECATLLKGLDIAYTPQPPLGGPGQCGTPYPLEVTAIAGVAIKPAAIMNCKLAAATHRWLVEFVQPAAAKSMGEPVKAIGNASSYVCRRRYGASTGKMSEHAIAGALDVGAFILSSGKSIGVMSDEAIVKAEFSAGDPTNLLAAARAGACKTFFTVLGPGSNAAHATHFHLDLARGGRYLICE